MNDLVGANENLYAYPDERGHFGVFGGKFVSETLMAALEGLELEYERLKNDEIFQKELKRDPLPLFRREIQLLLLTHHLLCTSH